jgi:hypothetical protein
MNGGKRSEPAGRNPARAMVPSGQGAATLRRRFVRGGFQQSAFVEAQANMRDLIHEYEQIEAWLNDGELGEEEEDYSDT